MDPLSQILAGLEAAWWLLWSMPAVPMAEEPDARDAQLLVGTLVVLGVCGALLSEAF